MLYYALLVIMGACNGCLKIFSNAKGGGGIDMVGQQWSRHTDHRHRCVSKAARRFLGVAWAEWPAVVGRRSARAPAPEISDF